MCLDVDDSLSHKPSVGGLRIHGPPMNVVGEALTKYGYSA